MKTIFLIFIVYSKDAAHSICVDSISNNPPGFGCWGNIEFLLNFLSPLLQRARKLMDVIIVLHIESANDSFRLVSLRPF